MTFHFLFQRHVQRNMSPHKLWVAYCPYIFKGTFWSLCTWEWKPNQKIPINLEDKIWPLYAFWFWIFFFFWFFFCTLKMHTLPSSTWIWEREKYTKKTSARKYCIHSATKTKGLTGEWHILFFLQHFVHWVPWKWKEHHIIAVMFLLDLQNWKFCQNNMLQVIINFLRSSWHKEFRNIVKPLIYGIYYTQLTL